MLVVAQDQEVKAEVPQDLVTQRQVVDTVAVVKKAAKAEVLVAAVDTETVVVEVVPVLAAKEITAHQVPVFQDKDVGVVEVAAQHKQDLDQTSGQTHQDQVATVHHG